MSVSPVTQADHSRKLDALQKSVLILLFVSAWINYMDRGNLGVAAPVLSKELNISPEGMGLLLSGFFWTYALLQPVAGWVVDRTNVAKLYGFGYLLWSVATVLTGFANGFAMLFGFRLLLGLGECVAYPCYSRILATTFPESKRGLANAWIDVGTKAGPALGTLVCGLLIASYGWRAMFIGIGLVSLIWLIPWFRAVPSMSGFSVAMTAAPPLSQLLRRREAWATFLGLFCLNYAWYFLVTWLPSYLVNERHYTVKMMAVYGALPFVATAISSLTAARISDRRIAAGAPTIRTRRWFVMVGLLLCGLTLPFALVPDNLTSMVCLIVSFGALGIYTSNCWALTQSLAGPSMAGQWTGMQNAIANMAGVLAPVVTGILVQRTGNYATAFYAAAGFLLLGACIYRFGLDPDHPLPAN